MARASLRVVLVAVAVVIAAGVPAAAHAASQAQLTLTSVFGRAPTGLSVPFGVVDYNCVNPPATGVTCVVAGLNATWYGSLGFRVRLSGVGGGTRVRLTGVRQPGGTVPTGALLDGAAGGVPTVAYPVLPAGAITLISAIGSGNSNVSRSVGLRVAATDVAGAWSTNLVYSLVVE